MKHLLQFFLLSLLGSPMLLAQGFVPSDQRIGDYNVSYANPEFSPSGNYMLWVEVNQSNGVYGKVWHCGIDPNTGNLIPSNGKGYSPFTVNLFARPADWGEDNQGPYYVGADQSGQVIMVRPTGNTSADTTHIAMPLSTLRRAFYPMQYPSGNQAFLSYVINDAVPGWSSNTPQNSTFQLRLVNLNNPSQDYLIAEQASEYPSPIPMDVIVPRWIKGTRSLTFGAKDANNNLQVHEILSIFPNMTPVMVTTDSSAKVDGHPFIDPNSSNQYLFSGVNGTDSAVVYQRGNSFQVYTPTQTIVPPTQNLQNPALNQSHEPFVHGGQIYSAYQVNNGGGNFFETTFNQPGEIWLSTVTASSQQQWLLSNFNANINVSEPEPFVGNNKAWVYYSAVAITPQIPYMKRKFQLRRCETPMNQGLPTNKKGLAPSEVRIYPNPVSEEIQLQLNKPATELSMELYDLQGHLLKTTKQSMVMPVHDLAQGIYLLKVNADGEIYQQKILK